jgi:hypothetical protein
MDAGGGSAGFVGEDISAKGSKLSDDRRCDIDFRGDCFV